MQFMKLFAKQFCHLSQVQIETVAHTYKTHSIYIAPVVHKILFYTDTKQNIKLHFHKF
jgi:hypothetical protein